MGQVVASIAYRDGVPVAEIPVEEAGSWAAREGHFVWIGLHEPKEALLKEMQRQFGLHDLAIEDALKAHQRPKVEIYGDSLFVVLRTARLANDDVVFGETHVFAGEGYIVTVRHGASASYTPVRKRCEATPLLLRHGSEFALYAVMDFVVDNFLPILDSLEADADRLSERLLRRPPTQQEIERIHKMRRDLVLLRRASMPLAEVCRRLQHVELHGADSGRGLHIGDEIRPYFQDVSDHLARVNETIATLGDLISFTFETSFMVAATRQNDVTRKLAAWAAILAVPTAIAGIYGMNFDNMPELKWEHGYYMVLALIVSLCTLLYIRFKRTGWL